MNREGCPFSDLALHSYSAAVLLDYARGDPKAKAEAPQLRWRRALELKEDAFLIRLGDAWPLIADRHRDGGAGLGHRQLDWLPARVLDGVAHDVRDDLV